MVTGSMKLCDLMKAVLCAAKKGSNIASIIRSNQALLELLVQEKKGEEKNARFVQDFKTLADVLIQEMVRHDLSEQFSGLESSIFGEETNKFTNALGETVIVKVCSTEEDTKSLLVKVLDGNNEAAQLLAKCLHTSVCPNVDDRITELTQTVDNNDIGVWIDPIDSTAQYIQGDIGKERDTGIVDEGLQCVTVLVGAFLKSTGMPLLGVAIQPFSKYNEQNKEWEEATIWGICHKDVNLSSLTPHTISPATNNIIMSTSEVDTVKQKLEREFKFSFAAGAGYKLICVAHGLVSAYVLSKSTIYRWDCCAPHAILSSIGGGIVSYKDLMEVNKEPGEITSRQVTYHPQASNKFDGIIAYKDVESLKRIVHCLKS